MAFVIDDDALRRPFAFEADLDGAVASTITGCPVKPGPDDDAEVTVSYEFAFVTPINELVGLGGSAGTVTLTSTSIMPCVG